MSSFKNADSKNDKIAFVGIPEWAKELDWEYVSNILAFFMVIQMDDHPETITESEIRKIISAGFNGEDKNNKTDYVMNLLKKHHVLENVMA